MTPARPLVPHFQNTTAACDWLRNALALAIQDPSDPWHQGTFAYTGGPDAASPKVKTVVWREWEVGTSTLRFYTDVRSAKWDALKNHSNAGACLYCPQRQVQLSLQTRAQLITASPEAEERFHALSPSQQSAYISRERPGAPFSIQSPPPLKSLAPDLGAAYFGIVSLQIVSFDFVSLHRDGHQRLSGSGFSTPETTVWLCP